VWARAPPVFDYDKLRHLNGVYLRALPPAEYADRLVAYLRERGYEWDEELVRKVAPLVQEKIATLGEFPAFAGFFFARVEPDARSTGRCCRPRRRRSRRSSRSRPARSRRRCRALAEQLGLKPRDAFQPIRLAVTGSKVSPGLFESLEVLGRDESLARLGSGRGGASGSSAL
jgi:glutamyl-tRNA synthetase